MQWLPGTIAISVALFVAVVVTNPRLSPRAAAAIAIVFEIAGSYGIAAAELLQPRASTSSRRHMDRALVGRRLDAPLYYRRSFVAAAVAVGGTRRIQQRARDGRHVVRGVPASRAAERLEFFFVFVFPYLLVVGMAYVGARVLFALGDEVRKARELGSYRLLERLGEGGMGEVWRARHRLLARPAAIKLIRPPTASSIIGSEAVSRFEREAQAIASLRSPHTVELFDFGIADDGTFYYVMELLDGLDAEQIVKQFGPMPAERVIHVIRQVCHSLSEAESLSLVHRDIKPANVVLCRYGEDYDFVKVLDFGIVKGIHEPGRAEVATTVPALSAEHVVRGTPAFIAPEQVLGGPRVDHRADIYATGCLTYWLLTGQLVFTGNTPMEFLIQHTQATPQPPSARTELPIPKELDAIVLACLAKNPSDRPQTARELARRLEAVPVSGEWTADVARTWWERHQPVLS